MALRVREYARLLGLRDARLRCEEAEAEAEVAEEEEEEEEEKAVVYIRNYR
jgi:hypothetical protein